MYYSSVALFAALLAPTVAGFTSFFPTSDTVPECSPFEISFQGSDVTLPLTLELIPVDSTLTQSIELPSSVWNEALSSGSYSTLVPFASGTKFIAVMHDATGRSNGGISKLITVQSSADNACVLDQPAFTSWFTLSPSPPSQCEFQSISWGAMYQPSQFSSMTISGYVPSGTAFGMESDANMNTRTGALWQVNVPEGQDYIMLFETVDAETGITRREASTLQTVTPSSDDTCLAGGASVTPQLNAPASTPSPTSNTRTSPSTTSPQQAANTNSANVIGLTSNGAPIKISSGAIIGAIFGVLIAIATICGIVFFYCRRRKARAASKHVQLHDDPENDAASTYSRDSTTPMISEKKGPFYDSIMPSVPPMELAEPRALAPLALAPPSLAPLALPPFRHSTGFNISYESPTSIAPGATIFHHDSRSGSPVATQPIRTPPFGVMGRSMTVDHLPSSVEPKAKKSLLSAFKYRKEAAFSIASWGNKGRLSEALSDPETRGLPTPVTSRYPVRALPYDPFAPNPVAPSPPPTVYRPAQPFPPRSRSLDSHVDLPLTTSPSSEGGHSFFRAENLGIGQGWPAPPLPGSRQLIPTPKLHVVNATSSDYTSSEGGYSEIYGAIAPGLPTNTRPGLSRMESIRTAKSSGTSASAAAFQGVAL